jgi:hypothetical protein
MDEKDLFTDGKGHSIKNMGEGYCARPEVVEMRLFIKSILVMKDDKDGNQTY